MQCKPLRARLGAAFGCIAFAMQGAMQMHYSGVSGAVFASPEWGVLGCSWKGLRPAHKGPPSRRLSGGKARTASLHGYAIKTALLIIVS